MAMTVNGGMETWNYLKKKKKMAACFRQFRADDECGVVSFGM